MKTDAYATGSALVALGLVGVSPKDASYRRGIRNLMLGQSEPGVWIVPTRSRPIQTYFDNGAPGGKSQFISTSAPQQRRGPSWRWWSAWRNGRSAIRKVTAQYDLPCLSANT